MINKLCDVDSKEESYRTLKGIEPSQPHIVMGSKSMQVDSTCITMDTKENPFATFNQSIVENIISYSSSNDEEEDKRTPSTEEEEEKETQ